MPPKKCHCADIRIHISEHLKDIILSKDNLVTKKEQMDIAHLVNLEQYKSLRSYFLKTIIMLYEKIGREEKDYSHLIGQFANLLKEFVVDLDRMRIEHPEEASPDLIDE